MDTLRYKRRLMEYKIGLLENSGEETFDLIQKEVEVLWKDLRKGYRSLLKRIKD